jgi:hypothetical protein
LKWLAIGFFLLLAAIVIAADQGEIPPFIKSLYRFPGGDKLGHFLLMGLLSFFVNMALPLRPADKPWRSLLIGSGVVLLVVTIEELSQGLSSNRTLSWSDWICSCAGIVCFGYAAWRLRLRRLQPSVG